MRLEHEQKSGAISVDFIPSVSLKTIEKWEGNRQIIERKEIG